MYNIVIILTVISYIIIILIVNNLTNRFLTFSKTGAILG